MTVADASLPLQKAVVARLKADAGVMAAAGARVYDGVPAGAVKPYVSMGPFDSLTVSAQAYEGSDTSMQVDGWADGPSTVPIKQLGRAIRAALHEADLVLDEDQRLVSLVVEMVRYLREPDSVTHHAVVTVRARTEPSA